MPRLDYHLTLAQTLTHTEQVVLLSTVHLMNDMREALGIPVVTDTELLGIVRQALRDVTRQEAS